MVTLIAPDEPDSWLKRSKRKWLVFHKVIGILFHGGGLIDGKGEKWWDLPCKPHKGINGTTLPGPCHSPVGIRFYKSSNVTMKGVKIQNSPQYNIRFDKCRGIYIDSIIIKAPSKSPNTDGIQIKNTYDVRIYNSLISTGDDCVSIGPHTHNVDIKNITCGPSHGISLGNCNSWARVSNITVSNSTIKYSDNGVRIKT